MVKRRPAVWTVMSKLELARYIRDSTDTTLPASEIMTRSLADLRAEVERLMTQKGTAR